MCRCFKSVCSNKYTILYTPIYKDDPHTEYGNYRLISVLPVVSKILERAILQQVYNHVLINKLLTNTQSGFRPQHSTLTAALDVTDYILDNMDHGELTGAIFLDLKKAIDTVNYNVLLSKLEHLGIKGRALDWFSNYLIGSKVHYSIMSILTSNKLLLESLRAQSLALFLFISFINDLPNVV